MAENRNRRPWYSSRWAILYWIFLLWAIVVVADIVWALVRALFPN